MSPRERGNAPRWGRAAAGPFLCDYFDDEAYVNSADQCSSAAREGAGTMTPPVQASWHPTFRDFDPGDDPIVFGIPGYHGRYDGGQSGRVAHRRSSAMGSGPPLDGSRRSRDRSLLPPAVARRP